MNKLTILLFAFFLITTATNAQFISSDDKLHIAAGAVISSGTYLLIYSKTKDKSKAFWYSLAASALAGVAKEVYDGTKKGNKFDIGEAFATTGGGLVASLTFDIFTNKKKQRQRN